MLSATYTIADVKTKLVNDYLFFDYTGDALFVTALTSVAEDVERIYFVPRLGQDDYDEIADKDKVSLTPYETALYWAEVYTICVEFLKWQSAKAEQLRNYSNETLKVEGYSHQISTGQGSSGADFSLKFYKDKMYMYWKYAGFDMFSLSRTCTIFGDFYQYEAEDK